MVVGEKGEQSGVLLKEVLQEVFEEALYGILDVLTTLN